MRVLAAHFERAGLEVCGGGLADDAADFAGAGEGDGADPGCSTSGAPASGP